MRIGRMVLAVASSLLLASSLLASGGSAIKGGAPYSSSEPVNSSLRQMHPDNGTGCETPSSFARDAGVSSIDNPSEHLVDPSTPIALQATVKNFGTLTATFPVTCTVDSCGLQVYAEAESVLMLPPGDSLQIAFSDWTPCDQPGVKYYLQFYTSLQEDQDLSNDTLATYVFVSGPSPTRNLLILQNYHSWWPVTGWASIESVLTRNAVPYAIYPDDSIGVVDLSPYTKVVLPSDQDNAFYIAVQANLLWFEQYVQSGGILEIHAADHGSGHGGEWNPLLPLPCNFQWFFWPDDWARMTQPGHEIVLVPNEIQDSELGVWNYVSHGTFSGVPTGVDTVIVNADMLIGTPALIVDDDYLGGPGRVIATSMTVEWSWAYGYCRLLENLLLYPNWGVAVDLISFTANPVEGGVVLTWSTESESGNYEWWIERSTTRESGYTRVATLPAHNSPHGGSYSWIDSKVPGGTIYWYRLADIDLNGRITLHEPVCATVLPTVSEALLLSQPMPNPFASRTSITYSVPGSWALNDTVQGRGAEGRFINLSIYDVAGRAVKTLVDEPLEPGIHASSWNGTDEEGKPVPSGVYLYRLQAGEKSVSSRVLLLR